MQKILVVDDEPHICRLLQFNLEKAGFEVLIAPDGKEGVEIAKKRKPDVILLDILMPEMNGIEACAILKTDLKTKNIPIFMLTALSRVGDMEDAFEAGADGYITKPFPATDIGEEIRRRLAKLSEKK